jgi:hypothetical protein
MNIETFNHAFTPMHHLLIPLTNLQPFMRMKGPNYTFFQTLW